MEDLGSMIQQAATNLPPIQTLIFLLSGVVGVVTVCLALANHYTESRRGQSPAAKTFLGLLIGSLLLSLPTVMNIMTTSIFGTGTPNIVESANLTADDPVRRTLHAITLYINVVGWIAAARGLWVFRTGPQYQEPGWVLKGIVFLVAGACATNFALFVDMLANTVGAEPLGTMYFSL